jgi:excisionase family DNA binding protein
MAEPLLTPEQAAERLRVSTKTLRQLRQRGLIRYVAVTQRKLLYRPEDCDAFVQSRLTVEEAPMLTRNRPTRRAKSGNVVSFLARRRERLGNVQA